MTETVDLARAIVEAERSGRSPTTAFTGPVGDMLVRLARELSHRSGCARCGFDPGARVGAAWVFVIARDPPSLNARIFNAGASRWKYRAERDVWSGELMVARVNHRIATARGRRRVTLDRLYGGRQRERDRDNLVGGMKAVVDALVLQGLLVNDTPALAELHYGQVPLSDAGERAGLRVTIEDLV